MRCIRAGNIESYIAKAGRRLSRASLQHDIAALRGFLRFLTMDGRAPAGLDRQIDTPRLYRLEQLPRALPWETVRTLLRSMDTASPMGLRDYAMFLLIATYGLRASEVVAINLEDIHWRQGILRIHQRKTSSPLELPLTNEVLSALVKHLKRTPPPAPYRRVFLRMRAPMGVSAPGRTHRPPRQPIAHSAPLNEVRPQSLCAALTAKPRPGTKIAHAHALAGFLVPVTTRRDQ